MIKGTNTYYILVYDGAGLKTKDTMRIFLATTADNSTSKGKVQNGHKLELDTLLVVTIVLVHHLDEVDSSGFNFEDRETVKSGKMFKVSSKACFLHEQVRPHAVVYGPIKAVTTSLLRSKELLSVLKISHQSF